MTNGISHHVGVDMGKHLAHRICVHGVELPLGVSNDTLTEILDEIASSHPDIVVVAPTAPLRRRSTLGCSTPIDSVPEPAADLKHRLTSQLSALRLDDRGQLAADYLIDAIDNRGVLDESLLDLCKALAKNEGIHCSDVQLNELRESLQEKLEPDGMLALTPHEGVLRRLKKIRIKVQVRADLTRQLALWGDSWVKRKPRALLKELDGDYTRLEDVVRAWRDLTVVSTGNADGEFVRPELVVRSVRGRWQVESIEDAYPVVMGDPSAQAHIHYRQRALVTLAGAALLKHQDGFLSGGRLGLRALTQVQVGDEIGVNGSTVSRLVNGRYIKTPHGVFELAEFFDRGVGGVHRDAFKAAVVRLCNEDHCGDTELAQRVSALFHVPIKRRVICKYRSELGIVSGADRLALSTAKKRKLTGPRLRNNGPARSSGLSSGF